MKIYIISLLAILSYRGIYCQEAYAVQSQTKGFSLSADLGIMGWTQDEMNFENETGLCPGLQALYGINHQWAISFQMHFATITSDFEGNDDYPLFDVSLGARYYFGTNTNKWRPFVEMHLNYMKLRTTVYDNVTSEPYKMDFRGLAGGVAGGVKYYITGQFNIFGILQANYGKSTSVHLDNLETEENYSFTTLYYGIGIGYNFSN